MDLSNRCSLLIVIALAAAVAITGCSQNQQAQDTGVSLVQKEQDQEQEELPGDNRPPEGPEMPEDMRPDKEEQLNAAKELSREDIDDAMGQIRQLGEFYTGREPVFAVQAQKVLTDVALNATNSSLRAAAVEALAAKPDEAVETLIRAIEDPSTKVRDAAILALGNSSKGTKAEAKLEQLTKSPNEEVKNLAAKSLQALRLGGGVADIIAAVAKLGQPKGDASAQAAMKIHQIGEKALPYLKQAIYESKDPRKRHAATMCVALICAGINPSQQEFAERFKAVHKGEIRADRANLDGLPILLHALNDDFAMTRAIAAQGLGYLGTERAARPLAEALEDPDVHVRRRAAAALITIPAASVKEDIARAALYDDDERVRRFAIEALSFVGGKFVTKAFIQATGDESPLVRRYTAKHLGKTEDPEALQALITVYRDARKRARESEDIEALMAEQDVRWAAVQAIGELGDPRGTDILLAALDDPVAQVSTAAEISLQKLGVAQRRVPGLD